MLLLAFFTSHKENANTPRDVVMEYMIVSHNDCSVRLPRDEEDL